MEKVEGEDRAKLKMERARSERLKQKWKKEYNAKNTEVKQSALERLQKRAAAAESTNHVD